MSLSNSAFGSKGSHFDLSQLFSKERPLNDNPCHVKVKRAGGYQDYSAARFHISVGQEYHEGQKFKAAMDWGVENFSKLIICVNDTLQRHNLIFEGKNPEEAFDIAQQLGSDWVERNSSFISDAMKKADNVEVVRWETWHKHPDFVEEFQNINFLYDNDTYIQDEINREAEAFWLRRKKANNLSSNFQHEKFLKHSIEYLKEECAIFSIMFREKPPAADVYPGSSLLPCRLLKDGIGNSKHGFTKIEFRQTNSSVVGNALKAKIK